MGCVNRIQTKYAAKFDVQIAEMNVQINFNDRLSDKKMWGRYMKQIIKWYGKIFAISLLLNILIELISRKSIWDLIVYIGRHPEVYLLNTLIILLPFTAVLLVRKKIAVCMMIALGWLALGVVNGFLLIYRTTPFTATDFSLAKYGLNMITTYMNLVQILASVTGILAAVFFCVVLWNKAPCEAQSSSLKLSLTVVALSVLMVLSCVKLFMYQGWVAVKFGNIGQAYEDYGFPYCFTNSVFNMGIPKPEDYGKEALAAIEEEGLIPENTYLLSEYTTPNIIMIQLESFFDPLVWEQNPLKKDPIPYFRYLMKNFPSGALSVPSVGAGTANTEFECITGMNLDFFGPGEYPYKTILQKTVCESVAYDLKQLGYQTHAIHNNEGTFYDRNQVFAQLGFDTFTPIEYMYHIERNPTGWCKDDILVDEILNALNSSEKQDFIYTISVQGHGAYPSFEYYGEQIHEMDLFVNKLLLRLGARKEPTVVVLYGDHLPGFDWEAEEMSNETLYETPYVIWNNMSLPAVNRDVESYQIAAYVLDMLNIHEGTMMRFHQKFLNSSDMEMEDYLCDMQMLEYDMLYGAHEIYKGELPFEATDLQMGITPIVIDKIVYSPPNVLVYGENFNQYSKVYINDKAVETRYVWPELIIAMDVSKKMEKDGEVTVKQVGKDKVPLGEAAKEIP